MDAPLCSCVSFHHCEVLSILSIHLSPFLFSSFQIYRLMFFFCFLINHLRLNPGCPIHYKSILNFLQRKQTRFFELSIPLRLIITSQVSEKSPFIEKLCAVNHKQIPGKARENFTKAFDKGHSLIK